jgi:hypothetical protein
MTEIINTGIEQFSVVRTTTDYTASNEEIVIADENVTVTLPTPSQGATLIVKQLGSSVFLQTPSGVIVDQNDKARYAGADGLYLVSDGTDWYTRSDVQDVLPPIPDSVVSRPDDNNSGSDSTDNHGVVIQTSQEWPDIQARISSRSDTASDEEVVISDSNFAEIASVDVSTNVSGDVITFNDVNLSANTEYNIFLRATNGRQRGYSPASYPYTSSDGDLQIVAGYFNESTNTVNAYGIEQIGNINL